MNTKDTSVLAIVIGSMLVTGIAGAQEKDQVQASSGGHNLDPVKDAVELTIGSGYAQGLGNVTSGQSLTDVGTAGGAVQLSLGYRIIPQLSLGVYGSGSMFGRADHEVDSSTKLYSASAGLDSAWHFLPAHSEWDPWISLGTGWRGYWQQQDQGQTAMQGWEIAKLQTGVDFRVDKSIAISPVIGADLTTFFTQQTPQSSGYANIHSPQVTTFLFAGLQGRFDIPTGSGASQVASR